MNKRKPAFGKNLGCVGESNQPVAETVEAASVCDQNTEEIGVEAVAEEPVITEERSDLESESEPPKKEVCNIHIVDHPELTQGREGTMSNNEETEVTVHRMTLDDGRLAERHVSFDADGNEVVEIFAEEKRPLKLEKRIHRQFKNVVAKETHEIIKDGEVAHVEVRSVDGEVPLRVVDKIGVADHAKIVDGDYVRKDEIGKLVADSVVAGVSALMETMEPVYQKEEPVVVQQTTAAPKFNARAIVESNVEDKSKNDSIVNIVMAAILLAQVAFFGYMYFMG